VIRELVESWGIVTETFAGSVPALEAIRGASRTRSPFHFVIADYTLPELDGAGLASAIKSDAATRQTIVVMLTPIANWRDCRNAEGEMVDACLVKPVRHAQLMHALNDTWMRRSSDSLEALAAKTAGPPVRPEQS